MAYPPSSFGERPPLQGFRRSFTAPHRQLSVHERAGLDQQDADAGILYTHPHVRIIAFAPPPESINSKTKETNNDADYPIDTVETLPWRSRTETLMTSGPLVIEKVRGSVPCFKCGPNFVQPIVRNSQCWCVDGVSKFVLRKGKLQYYRFELPTTNDQETQKVEEFKSVLAKALKYERTPCPFKRAFTVELPDDAITPRRKGKWKRREGSLPTDAANPPLRRSNVKLGRSFSMQPGTPSPLGDSPAERRGSDYGFVQTPRHTSLRTSYLADRPETPSSMASSEDLDRRNVEEADEDSDHEYDNDFEQDQHPEPPKQQDKHQMPRSTIVPVVAESVASVEPLPEPEVGSIHVSEIPPKAVALSNEAEHTIDKTHESPLVHEDSLPVVESEPLEKDEVGGETDIPTVNEASTPIEETQPPAQEESENQSELLAQDSPEADNAPPAEEQPIVEDKGAPEELHLPDMPAQNPSEQTQHQDIDDASNEFDLLSLADIPEGTFLPSTPELHYLEEHANLLEEHGFSDEELEPLAAAAVIPPPINITMPDPSEIQDDNESIASTTESFHTVDSIEPNHDTGIDFDATPLAEPHDPLGLRNRQHRRDISEVTVTASTFSSSPDMLNVERFVTSPSDPRPTTPRLVQSSASDESWPDPQTPSDIQQGLRRRLKSHRSLSPMPPAHNVFTSGSQNQGNHLTSAILQKACNVALVKPIEVVVLLVHVLARIAGGATVNDLMSGELFKRPHQRRHSTSFPDQVARQGSEEGDEEDDFGVPLRGRAKSHDEGSSGVVRESEEARRKRRDTDADSLFDLD